MAEQRRQDDNGDADAGVPQPRRLKGRAHAVGEAVQLTNLTSEQQQSLLAEAEAELARRSLLAFCHRAYPGYLAPAHLQLLIEHLEKLERGEIERLAVWMPPRNGKSLTCSQIFPAYFMGKNPRKSVIGVSYNQDLANVMSRKCRDIVSDESYPFDAKIRDDSRSVEQWSLNQGGTYIAAGCLGSITGKGGDLILLDDIVKSRAELDTLEKRDALYEWFTEIIYTRLMPKGKICYVSTRWHLDDLSGRIVDQNPDQWTVLRLPAIAEENDPLNRPVGAALWPAMYDEAKLQQTRETLGERSWAALYQQSPFVSDGAAFKAEYLTGRYDEIPKMERQVPARGLFALPGTMRIVERQPLVLQAVDAAWSLSTSSDYSAIVTVMYDETNFYVADVWKGRLPHPELVKMIELKYQQYKPRTVIIEKAAAGWAAIQSLQVLNRVPVYGIVPRSSKSARVDSVLPLFESGRVLFPRSAPWLDFTIDELVRFPSAPHDDVVDALTYCLSSVYEGIKVNLIDNTKPKLRDLITARAMG